MATRAVPAPLARLPNLLTVARLLLIPVFAVLLLAVAGRLAWPALLVLARDLLLIGGYKLVVPRGYDFSVSVLGKAATWLLYAGLAFRIALADADWPLVVFWVGLALAVLAGMFYLASAWREVR